MALAFGSVVYDGKRCKIFRVTEADASAAANTLTTTFAACGMTDFQGATVPVEGDVFMRSTAADENVQVVLLTKTATGFSIRKQTTGAGATAITWQICLRIPRGIGA